MNFAYYNFLKNHPNYREDYRNLQWQELETVLPINPKYGALELKTHPSKGEQMDREPAIPFQQAFCLPSHLA